MADINKISAVRDGSAAVSLSTGAASQTMDMTGPDEKLCLYVSNASASGIDVVVEAGDGIRSGIGDLTVTVPATSAVVIGPLDSMRFKVLTGTNKGKAVITTASGTAASLTMAAIQL